MSKAFTSETDSDETPLGPLPSGRRPITAAGMAQLQRALRQLQGRDRPQLLQAAAADEPGAHERLRRLDWRVQQMSRLTSLSDVAPDPGPSPTEVALGTRVRVRDERGAERHYALVGPDEVDAPSGRISPSSPLGRALMGQRPGAYVEVLRPAGAQALHIVAIEREAGSDELAGAPHS